ncbi:MAG: ATP-grasp domain-containing protein, partial [Clostridiales bacterium]|nr:ATP-grasp domain-containing protein [Clostridiales bacterium]
CITPHYTVHNREELLETIRSIEDDGISCVIKPVLGENRDGFLRIVSDKTYAKALSEGHASLLITRTILQNLPDGLTFSDPFLIMPYLPGQEWDVDILADHGKILSITIRKNLGMLGGLSACTETAENPVLFGICRKILSALPLSGLLCISFKEDADGQLKLLEINPRAMGSIYVSTLAGNSLIDAFFLHLEHPDDLPSEPKITPPGRVISLFFDSLEVSGEPKIPVFSGTPSDSFSASTESDRIIEWKHLTPESKEEYLRYYAMTDTRITDLTFHCRYAWDNVFNIEYAIIEDCLVQISDGDGYTSPFMLMPLGKLAPTKLRRIIEQVRPIFDERNWAFRICTIDENYRDMFLALPFPIEKCAYDRDSSDYLYNADSLRNLTGKRYAKKRNHLKHFLAAYPDHEYFPLEPSLFPECLDLVKSWAERKCIDLYDTTESDYLMIKRIFHAWEKLDLRGGAIRIDGKLVAFSIGSIGQPDTAHIHFEKADTDYDGLYVALCKYIASSAFPEVRYINREEDMGHLGLRQSKASYCPIEMVHKYKILYL